MNILYTHLFIFINLLMLKECLQCSVKCNPCMDLICPEVHVETASQPHYLPPPCECPRTCCCTCNRNPYVTHPPIMPGCGYHYPSYPYMPMPMPQHPPSYCVQSVVVGGKPSVVEEKRNCSLPNNRLPVDPGLQLQANIDPFGNDPLIASGRGNDPLIASGRGNDPRRASGSGNDPRNSRGNASLQASQDPQLNIDRYERYIERLLSAMEDRCSSEQACMSPSPMMVVAAPPCTRQVKVKKLRRKTHKKYRIASSEEDIDPVVVVEEEEEEHPTFVVSNPSCCCCRRPCCCRCRPCRSRACCRYCC